ncbi:hypothetical protein PR048_021712 [Dryococelus australis]|uniref:Uncharacterized protein n=1 Tax=Dryococelus australis TaxID=614101 RepID=A0ABQ9GYY5_9NEOP|nr:hypothetical protein PR048_021712 [Dryococelus australis]
MVYTLYQDLKKRVFCLRWLDDNFEPQERFLGIINNWCSDLVPHTGHFIETTVASCLPLGVDIRWAGNMSGSQKGDHTLYLREATIGTLWCTL